MTADDLECLLREIRLGRSEGDSLEWKRQWWDLSSTNGKAEFRRDIASLANSARGNGVLIVGFKQGRLHEAPPPLDEAELQQILDAIVPTPKVVIETVHVEGTTVSVLTVSAPYDRPYVAPWNNLNVVFVRHGSSIDSASRFELDAFYAGQRRRPDLTVEWQFWEPGAVVTETANSKLSRTLIVPPPKIRTPDDVRSLYSERLRSMRTTHERENHPTSDQLRSYEAQLAAFLDSIQTEHLFHYWYRSFFVFSESTPFTAVFKNSGTLPATDLKLQVDFPEWLLVYDQPGDDSAPEGFVGPPNTPPRPAPLLTSYERMMQAAQPTTHDWLKYDLPAMRAIQSIHKDSGAWLDESNPRATFWSERLLHAHSTTAEDTLHALALPNAPTVPGPIPLRAELFSVEQESWVHVELSVQLAGQS